MDNSITFLKMDQFNYNIISNKNIHHDILVFLQNIINYNESATLNKMDLSDTIVKNKRVKYHQEINLKDYWKQKKQILG